MHLSLIGTSVTPTTTMSAVKGKARVVEIADQESESEPETDLDDYESSSDSPPSDDRSECILPLEEPGVGTSTSYNRNPTGNKLKNRRTHFLFNFFRCCCTITTFSIMTPRSLSHFVCMFQRMDRLFHVILQMQYRILFFYSISVGTDCKTTHRILQETGK